MEAAPTPVSFTTGTRASTTLRWTVTACAQARRVRFEGLRASATVRVSARAPEITLEVQLDGDTILAIVRFVGRVCGLD